MVKEYIFKIIKEQYVKVFATNKEDAYDRAEERSFLEEEAEIVDIELVDTIEDEEDKYEDYILDKYEDDDYLYEEKDMEDYYV